MARDPALDHVPKADLHLHQEAAPRLDRLRAAQAGGTAYDWRAWHSRLAAIEPGMPRLERMSGELDVATLDALDIDDGLFLARVEKTLEEGARDGAVLIEVRAGAQTVLRSGFMRLFREAESRVRERYPGLRAEALISGLWPSRAGARGVLEGCLRARDEGLAGVDFIPVPYDLDVGWSDAYRWAERLSAAGLGITAHAGEVSPANLEAAIRMPGLTRLGHAVYAARSPRLLDAIASRGLTVECCLTSNVVYGAVESLDAHPLRRFVDAGVQVTLNSDNPVRLCTSIAREYKQAVALGFTTTELASFTRNAIEASFTSGKRKAELRDQLASDARARGVTSQEAL